jgi:hypothetical protein
MSSIYRISTPVRAGGTNPNGGPRNGTRKTDSVWPRSRTLISATTACITALRSGCAPSRTARSMSLTSSQT